MIKKKNKIQIRKAIAEINHIYPKDNLISDYKDFLLHRDYLTSYKYNHKVFEALIDLTYELWNSNDRINRTSLISIARQYYAKNTNSLVLSKITSFKIFELFKEIVKHENIKIATSTLLELKNAINKLTTKVQLDSKNEEWLCANACESFIILNRLLRYKYKSKIISEWAKYSYDIDGFSARRAELASWLIDVNPSFRITKETVINDFEYFFSVGESRIKEFNEDKGASELFDRELTDIFRLKKECAAINSDEKMLLEKYFRISKELCYPDFDEKMDMDSIRAEFYSNIETVVSTVNVWAIAYSRLSDKEMIKELKTLYNDKTERSIIRVSVKRKLIPLLKWMLNQ